MNPLKDRGVDLKTPDPSADGADQMSARRAGGRATLASAGVLETRPPLEMFCLIWRPRQSAP